MKKKTTRFKYKEDEKKYPWLPILLNAYHVIDSEYDEYIEEDQKRRGSIIACKKGCCNCCKNQSVPITPLELQGISWFVIEKMNGSLRTKIKKQLATFQHSHPCPFLSDAICSIYPVRPIACRSFFVYNKPCMPDEDLLTTRPSDILVASKEIAKHSALTMLPFYGISDENQQIRAFENGFIADISRFMHTVDWHFFSEGIEQYDVAKGHN